MQHLRRIVRFLVNNNNNIFISCKIALKYDLMYIISYGDFIKTAAILTRSENDKSPEVDFLCMLFINSFKSSKICSFILIYKD